MIRYDYIPEYRIFRIVISYDDKILAYNCISILFQIMFPGKNTGKVL